MCGAHERACAPTTQCGVSASPIQMFDRIMSYWKCGRYGRHCRAIGGDMSCSVLNDDGFIAFGCGDELVAVLNRVVIFSLNQIRVVHTTYIYRLSEPAAEQTTTCNVRSCVCILSLQVRLPCVHVLANAYACRHTPRKVCVRWLQHRVAAGRARTI